MYNVPEGPLRLTVRSARRRAERFLLPLFVVSATANVILAAYIVRTVNVDFGPTGPLVTQSAPLASENAFDKSQGEQALSRAEVINEVARLKSLGLTEAETMQIALNMVWSSVRASNPKQDEYWLPTWQPQVIADTVTRLAEHRAVRSELLGIFGPAAEDAKPFAQVYRPLDRQYPFLSSREQQAVFDHRLALQTHQGVRSRATDGADRPDRVDPSPARLSQRGTASGIASATGGLEPVLPQQKLFEIAVRESAAAERLRKADADLTEAQFREVFAIFWRAEIEARAAGLVDLQEVVARHKALQILGQFDPAWGAIARRGRELKVSDNLLMEVFGVVRAAADQANEMMRNQTQVSPEMIAAIAKRIADRDASVSQLVGPDVAAALLTSVNAAYRDALPSGLRPLQDTPIRMPRPANGY
jgi:hypothetical protein